MSASGSSATRLLLVLLLVLSAWLQSTVVMHTKVNAPLRVDAADYFSYARNLRDHRTYSIQRTWASRTAPAPVPDAIRPPGYPLFLYVLNPEASWQWLMKLAYVQSLLAIACVWLVFAIGRRFLADGWALAAAFLTAISPALVVMPTYMLSETLFTVVLLAAVLASVVAIRRPGDWRFAVLAGLAWGVSALVRPTSQFLPLLFLGLALVLPRLGPLRRAAAFGLLGFMLAMTPWLVRNQTLPPAPAGESLMVKALAHGSYPNFMYDEQPQSWGYPYNSDPHRNERARDLRSLARYIGADFQAHPGRMLRWYLVGKPIAFLSWSDPQSRGIFIYPVDRSPYLESAFFNRSWQAMSVLHPWLTAVAVLAMLLALWRPHLLAAGDEARAALILVAIVFAYAIAFHMLVAPFPRYSLPFRPLMFLLAMLALQAAWRWLASKRAPAKLMEPELG